MPSAAAYIAVDWGTTNRRVALMGNDGAVLDGFGDDRGVLRRAGDGKRGHRPRPRSSRAGRRSGRDAGRLANTDTAVIRATTAARLVSLPGYFTLSEAFAALAAGATALKLFPADGTTPGFLAAQRAVLPRDTRVLAVGGIVPDGMRAWRTADGFGLGSALYRAGKPAAAVARDAARFVSALEDPA